MPRLLGHTLVTLHEYVRDTLVDPSDTADKQHHCVIQTFAIGALRYWPPNVSKLFSSIQTTSSTQRSRRSNRATRCRPNAE